MCVEGWAGKVSKNYLSQNLGKGGCQLDRSTGVLGPTFVGVGVEGKS